MMFNTSTYGRVHLLHGCSICGNAPGECLCGHPVCGRCTHMINEYSKGEQLPKGRFGCGCREWDKKEYRWFDFDIIDLPQDSYHSGLNKPDRGFELPTINGTKMDKRHRPRVVKLMATADSLMDKAVEQTITLKLYRSRYVKIYRKIVFGINGVGDWYAKCFDLTTTRSDEYGYYKIEKEDEIASRLSTDGNQIIDFLEEHITKTDIIDGRGKYKVRGWVNPYETKPNHKILTGCNA